MCIALAYRLLVTVLSWLVVAEQDVTRELVRSWQVGGIPTPGPQRA
ncbi:MAG TPA: hypothetical protein VIY52_01395 [Streptosporangiaceae bacterium]